MASTLEFVVRDRGLGLNVEGRNGQIEYVEKASFSIELKRHIEADQNSGFLAEVNCSLREESR